ncbi:hypothetical protein MIT9_P2265 [Methylomarinovum caldicuralii]|uniref:Uncharacterized protein n=1 Tax=Methylomarinovum caldicuralii TaxID=438856 RepID=A0AAU9C9H4_9GAMM|nr:DUF6763 family protein [Methylomarinovum caldicuralii]BCX82679.1 hypothetical protein MIT9_P2265 [Methylomarinovum caldicuralii]
MNELDPIVGNWYLDLETDQKFEVVAVDEDSGAIEIQYHDGNIDELDFDAWQALNLEPIEPPEDWAAPLDDVEPDDIPYSEMGLEEGSEEWEDEDFPARGDDDAFHEERE